MSGFAGYIGQQNLKSKVGQMVGAIKHRGPDDREFYMDEAQGLALGFQRLSIQDTSKAGAQPMVSASGRYVLVYDGEIYNFKALRTELERYDHAFKGNSDTEVLLKTIEQWGLESALGKLNGMFAFALYDTEEQVVYFARDRMGQKPLYYGTGPDGFYFASELKGIIAALPEKPEIDPDVAALYFRWRYVPDPYCIYKRFRKLMPGSFMSLSLQDMTMSEQQSYWSVQNVIVVRDKFTGQEDYALNVVHETLSEAVRGCMNADVTIGAFLSGDVESSLVTALAHNQSDQPFKTFTLGFEGIDDPAPQETARALGTDHTHVILSVQDALESINAMSEIFDEPVGDPSAVMNYHRSRLSRDYMNVALSACGGAELFGGYSWYEAAHKMQKTPSWLRPVLALFYGLSPNTKKIALLLKARGPRALYTRLHSHLRAMRDPLLTYAPKPLGTPMDQIDFEGKGTDQERLMAYDSVMFLSGDVLARLDRAAMNSAQQVRNPLLEHELTEFIWSLPPEMRTNKKMIKKLLSRYVPEALIEQHTQGPPVPHGEWLRGPLARWAEDLLIHDYTGLLNMKTVQNIWRVHKSGKADHSDLLWTIVQFQAWAKRWV